MFSMPNFDSGLNIRQATKEDIPKVHEITERAFQLYIDSAGLESISALKETFEDIEQDIENKWVLVAYIGEEIVGSLRLEILEGGIAYLSRFAVSPVNQNMGIGKSMMHTVDSIMRKCHVKQLQLHTASKITGLIRFYYGRGFYIDSTSKDEGYIRAFLCKDYEY